MATQAVARPEFRHRLSLQLSHFSAGKAVWHPRCSCGWRAHVKVDDADAGIRVALGHTAGWFTVGMGQSAETVLDESRP